MPSGPTPRASGSESLRAGSAAVMRHCSAAHAEDAAQGGGHLGPERRGPVHGEIRSEGQRLRLQVGYGVGAMELESERLIRRFSPVPPAGQIDHQSANDEPRSSRGRRMNARQLEAAAALDSVSPVCCPAGQDPGRAAAAPSPAESALPRSSATTTLINALATRVTSSNSSQVNNHPVKLINVGEKLEELEPLTPPRLPAESTGHRRGTRGKKLNLTVTIPNSPSHKDIRHLGSEKIFDRYSWDEVLQEQGDGGKVVVCKRKDSPQGSRSYVMKMRSKESLREQYHEEEFRKSQVRMLNFPPHVGVMPLCEVLEDDKFYYIVMEKADGGSLFCSLLADFQDGALPHSVVKGLVRDLLEAVRHVHRQGMLHRDIKPDNLVMQFHDDPGSPTGKVKKVVLIDFDHADPDWSPLSLRRGGSCYGTTRFNAPETLMGEYSTKSDLYSVGAILYLLMAGKMPYNDTVFEMQSELPSPGSRSWEEDVYLLMKQEQVDWECSPWPQEPECKALCTALLAFQAHNRPRSAEEALAYKWLEA